MLTDNFWFDRERYTAITCNGNKMTYLHTAFGVLVLGVTIVDLLWTTLWVGHRTVYSQADERGVEALRRVGG